jgi:hypothetical protein
MENKLECTFYFDDLKVFGGFGEDVHISGYVQETNLECILSINKRTFESMFSLWLTRKLEFCQTWGHYCGVGGYVYCIAEKERETVLHDYQEEGDEFVRIDKVVPIYKVVSFDEYIDMEHG